MTQPLMTKNLAGFRDITIVNGALQLVEGDDEIVQGVEFNLLSFVGDWFLDLTYGIPYWGRVFARGINEADLYGIFTQAIQDSDGIEAVEDLNIEINSRARELRVTAQAYTETGNPLTISVGDTVI